MNKSEFLNILRQSLSGEVAPDIQEQNISYYHGYISSQGKPEEDVIAELGDPRLIAKTIIETSKIAREKSRGGWNQGGYQDYRTQEDSMEDDRSGFPKSTSFSHLKWYHKLSAVLAMITLVIVIMVVGRFVIGFLFAFGLPIILILLVMTLFRRR